MKEKKEKTARKDGRDIKRALFLWTKLTFGKQLCYYVKLVISATMQRITITTGGIREKLREKRWDKSRKI